MRFVSTRNPEVGVSFKQALFQGLAPDGGLYIPEGIPDLHEVIGSLNERMGFVSMAARLTAALLESELQPREADRIVENAFTFSPRLVSPAPGIDVLELFHGPSHAFKDFGASFLAGAMDHFLDEQDGHAVIVTATSGDTGSAVARAFHGKKRIDVVILYPSGRVSPLQEKQLTTLGGNICALEVDGSFDDCQNMAKAAFTNPNLRKIRLGSANSINLGRLLPQSFYYVWARIRHAEDPVFVVPSGNFGNLTAGLYAAAWGLPVRRFVAATNVNDVVPQYLLSGVYQPRPSVATYSNAMDVGTPSNFERLDRLFRSSVDAFRERMEARVVDDRSTLETIARVAADHDYLCCPHTAVGWRAAELYREQNPHTPVLLLATAHPAKFGEVIEQATGRTPELPEDLASLSRKKKASIPMGNRDEDLARWLISRFG